MSPIMLAALGLTLFLIFAGIGYSAWTLFNPTRSASDRLEELTGGPKREESDILAGRITERLSKLAQPETEEEQTVLRQRLIMAGYKGKGASTTFNAIRVGLALLVPLLLPVIAAPFMSTTTITTMAVMVVVGAAIGYYTPLAILSTRVEARKQQIVKPLPDALDLLVTSVEAGLGLDAAFRRVADEIENAAPELAYEFQMVNNEISAGFSRLEALHRLYDRTGIDEIKSLVNMLTQAERFGTSIARSLRVHSDITRQKRMSRAEEIAAKVSPKLTVVMILFLMPCLMVVLLGPAAVNIANSTLMD